MVKPALIYWALVFALAFGIGVVRVLWLAPAVGPVVATMIELPIVLAFSWLVARQLLRRFQILRESQALALGALAFAMLMAAELMLAMTMGGGSASSWIAGMATLAGTIGLSGQIGFALIPWIVLRSGNGQSA